jgi:Family of unknown function (DUF6256)
MIATGVIVPGVPGVAAAAQSSSLIRMDILPVAVGYGLIMGALVAGLLVLRRAGTSATPEAAAPRADTTMPDRRGWLRLIRHYVITAAGGYLLLMAVLIAYYFGVVHVGGDFISSGFTGCLLLLGLSSPVFLAASWLAEWRRQRRAARGSPTRSRESHHPAS